MKALTLTLLALTFSFNSFAKANVDVQANENKLVLTATVTKKLTFLPTACPKAKSEAVTAIKEECFLKGYKSCKQLSSDTTIRSGYGVDETKYCNVTVKYTAEM